MYVRTSHFKKDICSVIEVKFPVTKRRSHKEKNCPSDKRKKAKRFSALNVNRDRFGPIYFQVREKEEKRQKNMTQIWFGRSMRRRKDHRTFFLQGQRERRLRARFRSINSLRDCRVVTRAYPCSRRIDTF